MFAWLFSFLIRIPILGPLVEIVKGFQQEAIVKYKVDGTVDIEAMKTSAQIIDSTKNDVGTRLARDILIFPWALYGGISGWDYTVAHHWPSLVFDTAPIPANSGLVYLPHMVFGYLLGTAALSIWNRK